MSGVRLAVGTLVVLTLASIGAAARAGFGAPPFLIEEEPARRYARLDREACEEELAGRGARFVRVEEARGVLAPVRLSGPLHGVAFHIGLPGLAARLDAVGGPGLSPRTGAR
ncbi:MAG: hypothetical protein M3O50_16815 [Myxococcota bacterium]|nr:hypothetical protein [Myxococcota bacterium]